MKIEWEPVMERDIDPPNLPCDPADFRTCFVSEYAPYVTQEPKHTISVVRKFTTLYIGKGQLKTFRECHTSKGYRVKCSACGWSGYRNGYYQCECYDEWSYYCRPWTPGPGCPCGILWPCPQCNGHGK